MEMNPILETVIPQVILCVDDEKAISQNLQLLFQDDFEIIAFTNPSDALAHYGFNDRIVAVISDYRMAVMNGFEMFRKMKELCPDKCTYNVMYSGYPSNRVILDTIPDTNVDAFLTKTTPIWMLTATVLEGIRKINKEKIPSAPQASNEVELC